MLSLRLWVEKGISPLIARGQAPSSRKALGRGGQERWRTPWRAAPGVAIVVRPSVEGPPLGRGKVEEPDSSGFRVHIVPRAHGQIIVIVGPPADGQEIVPSTEYEVRPGACGVTIRPRTGGRI